MKLQYSKSPHTVRCDVLVLLLGSKPAQDPHVRTLNEALGGSLKAEIKNRAFAGKSGQTMWMAASKETAAKSILLIGLTDKPGPRRVRDAAATAVKIATARRCKSLCLALPSWLTETREPLMRAAEGLELGTYSFDKYKKKDTARPAGIAAATVTPPLKASDRVTATQAKSLLKRGAVTARAACHARDMVNEPAGFMTPTQVASEARAIGRKHGISVKVLGPRECEKLGMGLYLAVARGSEQPPRFVHMTYKPKKKARKRIVLVGKGVTFDSGGYSLKPSAAMEDMKMDMAGSACVVAAMAAIAELRANVEVHAIAACCENLVSGRAYKLGDVLRGMDGTTVEINNTDAEGRLTLADALTYARTKIASDLPVEIFDFATLTGACMVALGSYTAGVMGDDDKLVARWLEAARSAGEDMWRLPLNRRLQPQLRSTIADMKNTGERWGGVLTAGLFLRHFAGDGAWVHVDIAGPAYASKAQGATSLGGTGFGVTSIVEYVLSQK